jgi:hypothetical protein
MVKKSSKKTNTPKTGNIIPPVSLTGYPQTKPCKCPMETLRRASGGGKPSVS